MSKMKTSTIGNVCQRFSSGDSIKASEIKDVGTYPVFGGNGLRGYTEMYNFEGQCAIIGRQGAKCGNVRYFDGKAFMTEHAIVAVANKYNISGYIALKFSLMNLERYQGQSAQPGLSVNTLSDVNIELPETDVQKKVFSVFNSIDSKIALNNKIISELESMAKTLYDYWFLQFDFPDENGKPYKSSGGKMVYNEELKREIPEGWEVGSIKDFGEIIGGGTPPTSNADYYTTSTEGIGWITPYDMANNNNKYIAHGERDITKNGLNNSSAVLMPKGTVLMTSRAPIGYIGISTKELATNQGFKSVVPKEKFGSEFVYQVLISMIPYLKSLGTGSTFAEISKTTMEKVVVVIPPLNLAKEFNNKVMASCEMIQIREKENRDLVSLRDFLLPMPMNGQVTFKDAIGAHND